MCAGSGANPHCRRSAIDKATFGAGCFWGIEATFRQVEGVAEAFVGYAGGRTDHPTYQQVCRENTGHAEVVEFEFDPIRVSYDTLLDVFWGAHDPTRLNRQGPNFGDQYRSAIFYHSPEQKKAAIESKARLEKSGRYGRPIVTQIVPAETFWRAEEYHQRFLEKRGVVSCRIA